MKYPFFFLFLAILTNTYAQKPSVTFTSSDTALQTAFNRAKEMALSYKGKLGDPVGPWYESSLPPRFAFCMRDVSHQSIAAEILGLSAENRNMTSLFVNNISKSKDWCSYWEINKFGKPAAEDYRSDTAFWYNLNGNFDILTACWKLYSWTGDKTYINNPAYLNFYQKSTKDFIDTWVLQADSLLSRPSHPREQAGYNRKDAFHEYRGLPSYSEGVPHVKMGVDLVASIYRGLLSYSAMLRLNNQNEQAKTYEQKASRYQQHIENEWWDPNTSLYNTHFTDEKTFGKGEGETFLLWFDALKDSIRTEKTIAHLLSRDWNIENLSYFPYQLYRYGYGKEANKYVLHLTNPATERREYPEVSFGVIQAIVQGLMGIEADAKSGAISTMYQGNDKTGAKLNDLPILGGTIDVEHQGAAKTTLKNTGTAPIAWNAKFAGRFDKLMLNGKMVNAGRETSSEGIVYSYLKTRVMPGKNAVVSIR